MIKKRNKIVWTLVVVIFSALYISWIFYLHNRSRMDIIFWWEKTFRLDWETITSGMTNYEIYMTYIKPYEKLNEFSYMFGFLLLGKPLFDKLSNKKDKDYSKCVTMKDFLKVYIQRQRNFKAMLFHFSYIVLLKQIIKQIFGFGFPYVYGPLFIMLPIIYLLYDFSTEYMKWETMEK